MEEAGAGRFARRLRQRSRASAQGGRGRKGRALQTDRPTKGGVGLFKKKELILSLEDRRLWSYGPRVIYEGFNLTIRRGERWAVMGRNGSGKTTLLQMIAGTSAPYAGSVR